MSSETSTGAGRTPYNWRLLAILVVAILVSGILLTPYQLAIQGESLTISPALFTGWLLGTVQLGIMAAIGLAVAGRIGLGLPFLESWLAGRPDWLRVRRFVLPAILTGVLAGTIVLVLDVVVFVPRIPALTQLELKVPPPWTGFLGSFYGGIAEEIQVRLFILSLFAWIGWFVNRTPEGRPGLGALWVANVLAAVLFGLLHLPGTAAAGVPINALVVTRALVGNGLVGLICGWLYWTFGLEAAMVSHFSADMVLHLIAPLVAGQ
jgi:membrane protease YdiL (CAAX protease family)